MNARGLGVIAGSILLTAASHAHALDTEITSTTGAQGYTLRSPFGDPVITRRRFMQTLGLNVTNVEGGDKIDPDGMQVSFRMRLRFDADFGLTPSPSATSQARS